MKRGKGRRGSEEKRKTADQWKIRHEEQWNEWDKRKYKTEKEDKKEKQQW